MGFFHLASYMHTHMYHYCPDVHTHTGTDWIQEVCTGQRKWCAPAAVVAAAIAVWVGVVQTK